MSKVKDRVKVIEGIAVSGYKGIPHETLVQVSFSPLTIFIGGLGSGKSVIVRSLMLLGEYLCEGKLRHFDLKLDSYRGRSLPPLVAYKFSESVIEKLFDIEELVKFFPASQAVQLVQNFKETLRNRLYAPTLVFELSGPEPFVVPFVDISKLPPRSKGDLRRLISEASAEILTYAPQFIKVFQSLCSYIDYLPILAKSLTARYEGVPTGRRVDPDSYYYKIMLVDYASDDEFRERLREYLQYVTGYNGVRLTISESSEGKLVLGLELYDPMLKEWRDLRHLSHVLKSLIPLLISLAYAKPGSLVAADNVGAFLDPASLEKIANIALQALERGVQLVFSTVQERLVKVLVEKAVERYGEDAVAIYVSTRSPRGIDYFRVKPSIPFAGPDEAIKELKRMGFTELI